MNTFFLKILASDRIFFEGRCSILVVPAEDGEMAVMAHHQNVVISVEVGELRFRKADGTEVIAAVGRGFCHVLNNRVSMLVDTAEYPWEVDIRRAEEAQDRAQEQMRQNQSIQEYHHTKASLARAMSRLKISSKYI